MLCRNSCIMIIWINLYTMLILKTGLSWCKIFPSLLVVNVVIMTISLAARGDKIGILTTLVFSECPLSSQRVNQNNWLLHDVINQATDWIKYYKHRIYVNFFHEFLAQLGPVITQPNITQLHVNTVITNVVKSQVLNTHHTSHSDEKAAGCLVSDLKFE